MPAALIQVQFRRRPRFSPRRVWDRLVYAACNFPVRRPQRVWMPPVLQGDSRTFWRLGAYIARVSGLFTWLIVCHWPVCSSKNEVHIGSKSYDARAPGLVSTS